MRVLSLLRRAAFGGMAFAFAACAPPQSAEREIIVFSSDQGKAGGVHLWRLDVGDLARVPIQMTFAVMVDGQPALSPDGRLLAFARGPLFDSESTRVWIRSLDTGAETQITGDTLDQRTADLMPFWRPDGRSIGFTRHFRATTPRRFDELWAVPIDVMNGQPNPGAATPVLPGRGNGLQHSRALDPPGGSLHFSR